MSRSLLVVFLGWLLLPAPLNAAYEWRSFADDKDQIALWRDGRQFGNYRFSTREYFPLLASGVWGAPCEPPYPPPCRCCQGCRCEGDCQCPQGKPCCDGCRCIYPTAKVEPDGTLNFGLDLARIPPGRGHILNGKEVSKDELLKAIGKPPLPDDSNWLCLTIIGAEAARQQVLDDLRSSPALAPWKDKIKVQDYPPDHWAVKDAGFVTTGNPTIYCQTPDGKVLHRQDDDRGPEALAEALRKADATYKPEKDPDLNKPLSRVPLVVWIAGGILLILLLKGEQK
jgi:hypothetical protein